jgi:hypothetical protein
MENAAKALFIVGILTLAWGAADFYNLFTTWREIFQHYAGTDTEDLIRELGRLRLESGLIKAGAGILMAGISGYRIQREKRKS